MPPPIRTAVVGFGVSGRVFHAPFLAADPAYSLDLIVTGDPARAAAAAQSYPAASVVASVAELWARADDLDLAVIGAPPATHADIAVAITGIAGPAGGSDKKPVGTVVFARAEKGGRCPRSPVSGREIAWLTACPPATPG